MRRRCLIGFLATLAAAGSVMAGPETPRFAIYLVDLVENSSIPSLERRIDDNRYRNVFVTQEQALETTVKHGPPILTDADIVEYCWATQRVQLTAEGARYWDAQGGYQTALTGKPIQVEVDGESQYVGLIWNPASSLSCKLPQFWCKTLDNRLIIGGRYLSATGDTILGDTFDEQVKQVMGELGKLTADCRVE